MTYPSQPTHMSRSWKVTPIILGSLFVVQATILGLLDPPSGWGHYGGHLILPSILVLTLAFTFTKFPFTPITYSAVFIHFSAILYGAYYDNSHIPIGEWVADLIGSTRNPYDRFLHLALGLTTVSAMYEIVLRKSDLKSNKWRWAVAWHFTFAIGAIWEVLEVLAVNILAPEKSDQIRGIQGDKYDTQWDMAAVGIGAALFLWPFAKHIRAMLKETR
jgi:putative membrane protein